MVHIDPDCKLGPNRVHVLPPTSICPTVLDRQRSVSKEKHKDKGNGANPKQLQRADSTVDAVGVAAGFVALLLLAAAIAVLAACCVARADPGLSPSYENA